MTNRTYLNYSCPHTPPSQSLVHGPFAIRMIGIEHDYIRGTFGLTIYCGVRLDIYTAQN